MDAAVAADANYAIPVIRVADGTYSRVSITNDIALDVRSVNGAAATVIDGGGTNNCVAVITGNYIFSQKPTFTGFTLQNGNVRNQNYDYGGGALGGTLLDCVIQDCEAWQGGGTYKANTTRCIIRRCDAQSYGGIVAHGIHLNDLMYGNSGYWGPIYSATLYSCTIADNSRIGFRDEIFDNLTGGRENLKGYLEQVDREKCLALFDEYTKTDRTLY